MATKERVATVTTRRLGHTASSVHLARRLLTSDLRARGLAAGVVEDAALVASEILSNTVKYANPLPGGGIRLSWQLEDAELLIEVTDGGGTTTPRTNIAPLLSVGGRGLSIVSTIVADWGVRAHQSETTVWARLSLGGQPTF
jgi:anti-sigma regulatory factor (Ser/Thr protein kinase)